MENSKQTAVEWLVQQLTENGKYPFLLTEDVVAIEQAKAMEKEQIKDARKSLSLMSNGIMADVDSEQYYNETYGKDESK